MDILFINGSPNKNGNTAKLAKTLLQGKPYDTVDLVDYQVNSCGQTFPGDQFHEILEKMKAAKTIVIGSPVYWHNLTGALRVLLDRFYGPVASGELRGRKLFFVFQGGAPTQQMLDSGEYTIGRFAALYGMEYMGMATTVKEAKDLSARLS